MIKNLTLDQEKQLANELYYGGGYTKKYTEGGMTPEQIAAAAEQKVSNTSAIATAGLGLATTALEAFDDNPDFDGADVGKAALKGASLGANPALVAATGGLSILAGGLIGGGMGYLQKRKFEKEEARKDYKKEQAEGYSLSMQEQQEFAGYQDGGYINSLVDLPYVFPKASNNLDPTLLGYGQGLTGPPVKSAAVKNKTPKFKPDVIQTAAKKLNLFPSTQVDNYRNEFLNQFNSTYSDNTKVNLIDKDRASMFKTHVEQNWDSTPLEGRKTYMNMSTYNTGGLTKGEYSHSSNPLTVVDKNGNNTGMELTGGEGVFDKPFMGKLQGLLSGGRYQEAGKAVQNEMNTWKHK